MKKVRIFLVFALFSALLATSVAAAYVPPASITIKKAVESPVIDGNLEASEWGDPVWSFAYSDGTDLGEYTDSGVDNWFFTNTSDDEAAIIETLKKTKIDFYAMWDETYLYFGLYTENPIEVFAGAMEENDVANSWNARGIQFEYEDKDGTFNDIGFGTDGAGNTNQFWFMGVNAGTVMEHSAKVLKNGDVVIYEIAMKWADLNLDTPSAGAVFSFTLSSNFHRVFDGDPFFGVSIGGSEMTKNPDAFSPANISGDPAVVPVVVEEPPVEEPPAATEETPAPAPTTGDTMIIFIALMSSALLFTATRILKDGKRHS